MNEQTKLYHANAPIKSLNWTGPNDFYATSMAK